jgi:hypothetical protein
LRDDVLIKEVLDKCDVLKKAGFWPSEPVIRPRAWLDNFDTEDRALAAILLDKFTFYNHTLTDALLVASYHSIGDGLDKGPQTPGASDLISSLSSAVFTLVTGEKPNPTDSGYTFCRKARQILSIPEGLVLEPNVALAHAYNGKTVVFLDDFIGSGDQFLTTWRRGYENDTYSFDKAHKQSGFTAIYLTLITTDFGLDNIRKFAPNVAVCAAHILGIKSTVDGIELDDVKKNELKGLLIKYSSRLTPSEDYIAGNQNYLAFGYKNRGLMFGFEHSIPDATLPIFWSPGINWEPLIERV